MSLHKLSRSGIINYQVRDEASQQRTLHRAKFSFPATHNHNDLCSAQFFKRYANNDIIRALDKAALLVIVIGCQHSHCLAILEDVPESSSSCLIRYRRIGAYTNNDCVQTGP